MKAAILIIILLLIVFGICLLLVRRHYQKLLDVAIRRAQKSEQLKSVFIDNISRTLRSPLNAIAGFCNKILEEEDALKDSSKSSVLGLHLQGYC